MDFWENGKHQDQVAVPSQPQARAEQRSDSGNVSRSAEDDNKPVSERSQEPRFGFGHLDASGGGTVRKSHCITRFKIVNVSPLKIRMSFNCLHYFQGYGVSSYAPTKIDLGGLILGAVIGVGTILIIPKLLYIISGSYGAYARSKSFLPYLLKFGKPLLSGITRSIRKLLQHNCPIV